MSNFNEFKKTIDIIKMEKIEPIESRLKGVLIYPESGYWNDLLDKVLDPQDRMQIGSRDLGGNCGVIRKQNGLVEMCYSLDARTGLTWGRLHRSTSPTVVRAMEGFDNVLDTYEIPGFILSVEKGLVHGVIDQMLDLGYNISVYKAMQKSSQEASRKVS